MYGLKTSKKKLISNDELKQVFSIYFLLLSLIKIYNSYQQHLFLVFLFFYSLLLPLVIDFVVSLVPVFFSGLGWAFISSDAIS